MEKNTSKSFNYYRVNFGGSKFKVREWLSTGKLAQGEKRKSENGWGDDKPILQISNLNRPIQQSNFRSFGLVFFTSSFFGEKTLCNQTLAWILEHQTGLFHIFLTQRTSTVHCHVIQNNNKKGTSRRSRGERERVTKNRIRRWKEQQLHSYWRSDKNHTPTKKKKKWCKLKSAPSILFISLTCCFLWRHFTIFFVFLGIFIVQPNQSKRLPIHVYFGLLLL